MIKRIKGKKKGVSPVVATVLLIAIVVVLAIIVFLWIRGLVGESITKDFGSGAENVKLVCNNVQFQASYSDGYISISNSGNVPIYKMKLEASGKGNSVSVTLTDNWQKNGLAKGDTYYEQIPGSIQQNINSYDTLTLVPVLLGKTNGGEATYSCDSNGYDISING